MLQFLAKYTGEIDYFSLDFLKLSDNAGPSEKFIIADDLKEDHNERELKR